MKSRVLNIAKSSKSSFQKFSKQFADPRSTTATRMRFEYEDLDAENKNLDNALKAKDDHWEKVEREMGEQCYASTKSPELI